MIIVLMKIMFYTQGLSSGGAERVICNLSNYLINQNDISILINTKRNIAYKLNDKIKVLELDVKRIRNPLFRNIVRIIKTKEIVQKEKPDVIISFLPIPSFRILYLKKKIKCKVIVTDRNNPQEEYKSFIDKFLMKWLYKRADNFIFQTRDQQMYFNDIIQKKSIVIPNSLKEDFLVNDDNVVKEKTIINVGRLVKQKNQKLLIEAFSKISSKFPDYKLKIFGDGPLKDELQLLIDKLNLKDKVQLCGLTDNIKNEFLKSEVFVLSSDYEGMPNALIEAMACGLPCISTDCPCGGPKELIDSGVNGILIPVDDEESMANELDKLLKNDKKMKLIGTKAKGIRDVLNPKIINNKWEQYIKDVVSGEK